MKNTFEQMKEEQRPLSMKGFYLEKMMIAFSYATATVLDMF